MSGAQHPSLSPPILVHDMNELARAWQEAPQHGRRKASRGVRRASTTDPTPWSRKKCLRQSYPFVVPSTLRAEVPATSWLAYRACPPNRIVKTGERRGHTSPWSRTDLTVQVTTRARVSVASLTLASGSAGLGNDANRVRRAAPGVVGGGAVCFRFDDEDLGLGHVCVSILGNPPLFAS